MTTKTDGDCSQFLWAEEGDGTGHAEDCVGWIGKELHRYLPVIL